MAIPIGSRPQVEWFSVVFVVRIDLWRWGSQNKKGPA
jgi:hypothetical protein